MAYNTKYFANYKNVDGKIRTILLQSDTYESEEIFEWCTGEEGAVRDFGNTDSIFGNTIGASKIKLRFLFKEHHDTKQFVESKRSFKVELRDGEFHHSPLLWSGFVDPWDAKHDYMQPNYFLSMTASCGLNRLSTASYDLGTSTNTVRTEWEIIKNCLATIGLDRDIRVSVHTAQNAYPARPNPMTSVKIDTRRFEVNGEMMKCDVILRSILNKYNAEIFLWNGMWLIQGTVDQIMADPEYTYIDYFAAGGQGPATAWPDTNILINAFDKSFTLDGGVIGLQGAIRRYIINADLGQPKSKLANGNLQQWDSENGPVGWLIQMNKAPGAGLPGWSHTETAGEKSALTITGFAPEPTSHMERKKKLHIGKIRIFDEPAEWIEPPAIEIKRTDKTVTLTFEYQTEADSNGFIFSTWIESSRTGVKLYSRPEFEGKYKKWTTVGYSDRYTHRLAPPAPLIDPVTGKKLPKGRIEVVFSIVGTLNNTFDENPPAGAPALFDSLHVRFYKTYNKDGKTGDSYTLFGLDGADQEEDAPSSGDNLYKVVLQDKVNDTDAADEIQLISGDYSLDWTGATFTPDSDPPVSTGKWHRRGKLESISIYRAMLMDRISLTWVPLEVLEGEIKILKNKPDITYLNNLQFNDNGNKRFKIVRYSFEEHRRIVKFTAIQVFYTHVNPQDVIQKNYTEAAGLIESSDPGDETGGDGIFPEKQQDVIVPGVSDDDPDQDNDNARMISIFDEIPPLEYVVAVESEDSVDLADYFSEDYLGNFDEDIPEEYRHDPSTFVLTVLEKPEWVSKIVIDGLEISVTAKAPKTGTYYLKASIYDPDSKLKFPVSIPLLIESDEEYIEEWPPVFIDIPTLFFKVGKKETKELLLTDYLDPDGAHDGTGLYVKLLSKPSWVTLTNIVNMNLVVEAAPKEPDTNYVSYSITDKMGREPLVIPFEVVAVEQPEVTYQMIETGHPTPVILGDLPGAYYLPTRWDALISVEGTHNIWSVKINKGSDPAVNTLVEDKQKIFTKSSGKYRAFEIEDGIVGEVGLYRLEFATFMGKMETYREVIFFTIYDELFLSNLKFELWNEAKIGEIDIDGSSQFKKPEWFTPKASVSALPHNKAVIVLSLEGVVVTTLTVNQPAAIEEFEYYVYSEAQAKQPSGKYTINAKFFLDSALVYERQSDFVILEKEPVVESGLTLVAMRPNTVNFDVIQELPLKGMAIDLPENGWNVLCENFSAEVDYVSWEIFEKNTTAFTDLETFRYVKKDNYVVYSKPQSKFEILAFWGYSSKDIGDIHKAPSTFRFRFIGRIGGANGEIVGIKQADVTFRTPLLPGDYSGLRFTHMGGGVVDLIDPDMPKTGATYTIPKSPIYWSVNMLTLKSGKVFDQIRIQLFKDGVPTWYQAAGANRLVSFPVTKELTSEYTANTIGEPNEEGKRYVFNIAGEKLIIDEPGLYKAVFIVYRLGVIVETLQSEFTLVLDEDIPETPESDCCGAGEDEVKIFEFVNLIEWVVNHNRDRYVEPTIYINDEIWGSKVQHINTNTLKVIHKRPRTGKVIIE